MICIPSIIFFTPEQCRLKLKSMKEKYERNKKKNNKSGESPADSDDEELEEIFEKLHVYKFLIPPMNVKFHTSSNFNYD